MWLTESCPDRYWGASLSMLGLMGDVTEMDGRSIFWDSKELEPAGTDIIQPHTGINKRERNLPTLTWFQLCMCAVWYPWNISGKGKKESMWDKRRRTEVVGRDQIDLMLTVECFNDYTSCINLHLPNSSLSCTKQLTYRNWQSKGYCCFYPHLSTSETIGGEAESAVQCWPLHSQRMGTSGNHFLYLFSFGISFSR